MKTACLIGALLLAIASPAHTQTGVGGHWRAVWLPPAGPPQEFTLDLAVDGATVTGTALGASIREGRVEGNTVILRTVSFNRAQEATLTGQLSGDWLLFSAVGFVPVPTHFIARRDALGALTGRVSDSKAIEPLMKRANVPGLSIAIIQDFQIVSTLSYGIADRETGAPVSKDTLFQAASVSKAVAAMASLKAVQDGRFTLDQNVNTILKSWKVPDNELTNVRPITPRMLMSHTSGMGDYNGVGYAPGSILPTVPQLLAGVRPPSNQPGVRVERLPFSAFKYSGGGAMTEQLALTDAVGKPFAQIAREWIFDPIGMTGSTFEQPLPLASQAQAARAHDRNGARMGDPWHVFAEQAAGGLWTTATDLARFALEVQLSLIGKSNRVLSKAMTQEMIIPAGIGPYAMGFEIVKQGEGWYFMHTGHNWGFQAVLIGHLSKGYGAVIMTNADSGDVLIRQVLQLIQQEYKWDALDAPLPPI
jgi:CubicO group peptidase (beta-lactamase class C family)